MVSNLQTTKTTKMKTLITITLLLTTAASIISGSNTTDLSKAEKEGIQLMREEEKLAHDVYLFLLEKWNLPIFNNISNSETRHFNAVGYLIENFEIEDISSSEVGKFQNEKIALLYDSLTQKGSETLVEALKVGAFIEEFDIADLQNLLAIASDSTIAGVYQNLLRGSGNHLRAFTFQLQNRNEIYKPVVLNEADFLAIIEAPHQTGAGANCVLQQTNCMNQQNKNWAGKGNRGKGRMCRQRCNN